MSQRIPQVFGGAPESPPLLDAGPVLTFITEWPWLRPLSVILAFSRWTIDDVVSSRRAALEVRILWKTYKLGRRIAEERARQSERLERFWFRRQGCPIPCPDCGRVDACGCRP